MTAVADRPPGAGEGPSLLALAWVFLRLGTTAFGGPAAHIAMMREEFVERRKWLTDARFLDLIGAANLIPGPNSTEVAIHVGQARGGWRGLLVAGTCFILPAAFLVWALARVYVRYGSLPEARSVLHGVTPVIIAIVVRALWTLGHTAVKSAWLGALAGASLLAVVLGVDEIAVLLLAGLVGGIVARGRARAARGLGAFGAAIPLAGGTGAAGAFAMAKLFLVFLKAGALLFGSGYVLLAFLRADLVTRLGWLTERQLLDAIAVGQVTPGPVFTTATFIGYVLGGTRGSVIATLGIFLPAFVYVAASAPLLPRLRRSKTAAGVLDGVNVASLALMLAVTWHLARAAIVDWPTGALAVFSLVLLGLTRINSVWLVLAGGLVGYALWR